MKIKKGNLNFDQSGRAYPNEPQIKENWECIWEHEGKYYKLVGDDEHKEWEEVNMYNQIIDKVYENYCKEYDKDNSVGLLSLAKRRDNKLVYKKPDKEIFIGLCEHDKSFSEKWRLKIEERELSLDERNELLNKALNRNHKRKDCFSDKEFETETLKDANAFNIPTKLITVTHNNETNEIYE